MCLRIINKTKYKMKDTIDAKMRVDRWTDWRESFGFFTSLKNSNAQVWHHGG